MNTNNSLIDKINKLTEKQQQQVSDFIDSIQEYKTPEPQPKKVEEPSVEYQVNRKPHVSVSVTPADFQEQLYELTGRKDPNEAFTKLVQWYLRAELFRLEHQKKEFEGKWGMTFEEFEVKSMDMPDADSMEMEELYFDWDAVVGGIERKTKLQEKWK